MSNPDRAHDEKLEDAFDSVIKKLGNLQRDLDAEEQAAFMVLIKSAQAHAGAVQARDEGDPAKIEFMKPIQVHVTKAMKERMVNLPSEFSHGE